MPDYEAGQRWRLLRDHGNPPLHLRAGSVGTVREIVSAETPGAHDDQEDAVVLEFEHQEASVEEGEPKVTTSMRAVAFGLDEAAELLEEAG